MTNRVHYLTQEGYDELERKLTYLRTDRRQEIAERLHLVMTEGGELNENAEYESAKADQAYLENEIQRIEEILSNAEIIDGSGDKNIVGIGDRVTLQEKGVRETEVYILVGPAEANPRTGKISHESPLGQSLMGKQVGEKVKVRAPDGDIVFEILAIE